MEGIHLTLENTSDNRIRENLTENGYNEVAENF